jgi:hypothetical protein
MKKLFLLLFFSIFLLAARAQTGSIKGKLADEQGQPLAYATLLLKIAGDSAIYRSALSDQKGGFLMLAVNPGRYMLEISMLGFEKRSLPQMIVTDSLNLGTVVLNKTSNQLATVTVKAEVPLIDRQIDKTVVNVAQNLTNEGATVLEVMQKLPGVQVTPDGRISMNGRSGINVLIDGKPTYLSAGDLATLLSGMPASSVQKIEIMTNPSAKYDAAGTGGLINIVKKKTNKAGFNGMVSGSLVDSHYGYGNGDITLNYKNNLYNLFLNDSYTYRKTLFNRDVTSDILNPDQSLLTKEVSNNDNINAEKTNRPTIGLDIYLNPKTTLSLSGTGATGSSDFQTLSTMDIFNGNMVKTNHEDFVSPNTDHPYNYNTTLQLSHQLDTLGKAFIVDLDYADYHNQPTQTNHTTLFDADNNFISETDALLLQQRRLNIYAAKADYTEPLPHKGVLEAGIKSSYVKAVNDNTYYNQAGGLNIPDTSQSDYSVNTESINAAYVNLSHGYQKFKWEAGLRAEQTIAKGTQLLTGQQVDQNYLQLFPTLFMDYKADENNGFNIKMGRRTERADYSEMVPFRRPLTPTLYFEGNPNLKPQLSYHAEINWAFKDAFFITLAYDVDRDYIRTIPYLDSNKITITRRPTNVQGAHSWDLNFAYSKKLYPWWSTDNTLLFYQNAFNGSAGGFSLDNPGILSVYLGLNNSFTLAKTLSAEADYEYNTKREFATSSFGAYSLLSFGLKQQLFAGKGSISLNGHNVLQGEGHNAIDLYSDLNQYSVWHFYTRSATLTFTYRFGSGKTNKSKVSSAAEDERNRAGN